MKFAFVIASSNYSFFQGPETEIDPPLGVLHLATVIQKKAQTKIFDGQLVSKTPEHFARDILKWKPEIIGFSLNFSTVAENTRRMASYIRKVAPDVHIVFGGNYATFQVRDFVGQKYCDAVFLHEAEASLPEYLDWIQEKKGDLPCGVYYAPYDETGLISTPFKNYIQDLDTLPICDYGLFENPSQYAKSLVSSRGCPYTCIYCSTREMWQKWRCRSAENVVEEMLGFYNDFGTKQIYFSDDIFIVNKKRAYEMCDALTPYSKVLNWGFSTRLETLSDEIIPRLAKAGVTGIFLGIESGSNGVLSKMARRYTQEQIIHKVDLLAEFGITATTSFIVGLPYETQADVQETFKTMRRVRTHRVLLNIFTPLVGTGSVNEPEKHGITLHEGFDAERAVVGHGYVHFNTPFLSSDEIRKLWLEGQSIVMNKGRTRNVFEVEMERKRYGMLSEEKTAIEA